MRLETEVGRSDRFPGPSVGADAIEAVAAAARAAAGVREHRYGDRWCAVLEDGVTTLTAAPRDPATRTTSRSRLRSPAVTARVGLWLGICFGLAFVTGLISHWAQTPSPWLPFPTSPSWGYRVTQGLHVIAGTAAVPLLLVKLWTVFPKLFARPPREVARAGCCTALERVSIAVLVAAAIFQLATGLANAAQWYPWHFTFRPTHYAVGWVAIGALVVHIAVKLPIIRAALDLRRRQHRPGPARHGRRARA